MFPKFSKLAPSLAVILVIAGCAKPESVNPPKVRGIVTFQGRSTTGGLIVFTPDREKGCTGKIYTAMIGTGGEYTLDEKQPETGWYKVSLSDPPEWYGSDWERAFPASLRRPDMSGIERQIKPGENIFDFPIEVTE